MEELLSLSGPGERVAHERQLASVTGLWPSV